MKFEIKNIGKIKTANLELNGITVIAGENNAGKSTLGKALYSIFNGMSELNQKIEIDRFASIERVLENYIEGENDFFIEHEDYRNSSEKIIKEFDSKNKIEHSFLENELKNLVSTSLFFYEEGTALHYEEATIKNNSEKVFEDIIKHNSLGTLHNRLMERLTIKVKEIQDRILSNEFRNEFGTQIRNLNCEDGPSEVSIQIKDNYNTVEFMSDESLKSNTPIMTLSHKCVYIDNPFVLDGFNYRVPISSSRGGGHQRRLQNLLRQKQENLGATEEIILDKKLSKIYSIFSKVNVGNLVGVKMSRGAMMYREGENEYSLSNVSLGLKTFIIIKTLIQSGEISEGGTIILDEPEIHLHPEWQIMFAELIVLLQKTFHLHILLTTHSPYFLEAIEIYSKIHGIENLCNYYLNENAGNEILVKEVTGTLETVYSKFFEPFQKLEDLRSEL